MELIHITHLESTLKSRPGQRFEQRSGFRLSTVFSYRYAYLSGRSPISDSWTSRQAFPIHPRNLPRYDRVDFHRSYLSFSLSACPFILLFDYYTINIWLHSVFLVDNHIPAAGPHLVFPCPFLSLIYRLGYTGIRIFPGLQTVKFRRIAGFFPKIPVASSENSRRRFRQHRCRFIRSFKRSFFASFVLPFAPSPFLFGAVLNAGFSRRRCDRSKRYVILHTIHKL